MATESIRSTRPTVQSASLPLTKDHEAWIKRAWDAIDEPTLGELNRLMASIPSPTGEEGQLARAMVEVMNQSGVGAFISRSTTPKGMRSVESREAEVAATYCFMRLWIPPSQLMR